MKKLSKRNDKSNTCLTECVAYIFNLHPLRVPFFVGMSKRWLSVALNHWCRKRGYIVQYCEGYPKNFKGLAIATGVSPRNKKIYHSIVVNNNRVVFDSTFYNDSRLRKLSLKKCLHGKPEYYLKFKKIALSSNH